MNWWEREGNIPGEDEHRGASAQEWLQALPSRAERGKGNWFRNTLNIELDRRYWGRASSYSDAELFSQEGFQMALIETITTPGRTGALLIKELKDDRKKRRKSTLVGNHVYYSNDHEPKGILAAAIESGCGDDLVKAILDTGYDPNTQSDRSKQDTRYKTSTPVAAAISMGRADILKTLVQRGAGLDGEHLRQGIDHAAHECIDVILEAGVSQVKVNENVRSEPSRHGGGWTAGSKNRYCPILVYAAKQGDLATVEKLVERGADINAASWDGDAISLFDSKSYQSEISGEALRKMLALGAHISGQAALRIIRNGDMEAVKLLAEMQPWPSPEVLTGELSNTTCWREAGRLIEAGAPADCTWKYAHPKDHAPGRYERKVDTITWLTDAFGTPPPVGMIPPTTAPDNDPAGAQSLIRRLEWQHMASEDPARAVNDPLCPHPDMAWGVLLAAGYQETDSHHDFFETDQDRARMDEAITLLASVHPIDLSERFVVGAGTHYPRVSQHSAGERILCGRWSTDAAMKAFQACGGGTTPPEKGTWHGAVASYGPIYAETNDSRAARILALAVLGWKPSKQDIAVARKQSVRELLWSIQGADEIADLAVAAPRKKRARKAGV